MMKALAACLSLLVLLASSAAAKEARARSRRAAADDYQEGLDLYSRGRLTDALAAFKAGLRARPGDTALEMARLRVERELAAGPAAEAVPGAGAVKRPAARSESWSDRFDRFVLVDARRWLNPEDFVGERLAELGTLEALRGRVAQLLGERRLARLRRRRFGKERELRALVRRMPAVVVV